MLPSASSLQRVMMCTPSGVLPRVETDEVNEAADSGTIIHKYLELVAYADGEPEWRSKIPEQYHGDCMAVQLDKLPPLTRVEKEIAYAFDGRTGIGRVLGRALERDYSACTEFEYPGTADVVGVDADGGLVIMDYKTGSARTTAPASENWQVRLIAVCASEQYGIDHGKLSICKTRDNLYLDVAEFGPEDLQRWKLALMSLCRKLKLRPDQMTYRLGDHCRYCPSALMCEAQTSLVRAATQAPMTAGQALTDLIAVDPALAYAKMRAWEKALGLFKQQMSFFARSHGGVQLGDGKVYGEVQESDTTIDPGVAWNVIKESFGLNVAEKSVTIDVSQASIKRGLSTIAKRGELAGMVRDTMQLIGNAGGLRIESKTKLIEHKPKE